MPLDLDPALQGAKTRERRLLPRCGHRGSCGRCKLQAIPQQRVGQVCHGVDPRCGSPKTLKISIDEAATSDYPPDTMDEEWMMGIPQRRGRILSLQNLIYLAKLEIPTSLLVGFSAEHCIPLKRHPPAEPAEAVPPRRLRLRR